MPPYDFDSEFTFPEGGVSCPPCCGKVCVPPYLETEVSLAYGVALGVPFDLGSGVYTGPGDFAEYAWEDEDNWSAKNYRWRIFRPVRGCHGTLTVTLLDELGAPVGDPVEFRIRATDPAGADDWNEILGDALPPPTGWDMVSSYLVQRSAVFDFVEDPG